MVRKLDKQGKAVPLHPMIALGGGEKMYSSYSFLTLALDGGEWSASHPGHALHQGKDPQYPLDRRLGGPQSRSEHGLEEKSSAPVGVQTPIVHPVVGHYTAWATMAPVAVSALS
jgi:hypothetical protein